MKTKKLIIVALYAGFLAGCGDMKGQTGEVEALGCPVIVTAVGSGGTLLRGPNGLYLARCGTYLGGTLKTVIPGDVLVPCKEEN